MDTLFLNANCQPLCLLPMSIVKWQDALKSLYTGKASVLLEYEDRFVHSPSTTLNVPSVIILKEYKRPKRFPAYNRDMIFLRDEYTCQYCGLDAHKENCKDQLTLDHYIPKSKGGKSNFENIVTACMSCNMEKSDCGGYTPKTLPYKPSYYQLVNKRKKFPIYISDERWNDYLMWDEKLLRCDSKKVDTSFILDI